MTDQVPPGADEKATAALLQLAEYAERLSTVEGRLEAVEGALAAGEPTAGGKAYKPQPARRWWLLEGADRDEALGLLRAWVEQIYKPLYGHLATRLPPCWEQHPLCLMTLDWLSELWQVLYLRPGRTAGILASQAEWQTRLLPAAAEQMHADAVGCPHRQDGRR